MKTHILKTWPESFEAVRAGWKAFEIRKDDRGFELADILILREWDPAIGCYTGREVSAKISYVARANPDSMAPWESEYLAPGVVVLGLFVHG